MAFARKSKKIKLSTNPTNKELLNLKLGDIVYLDGTVYTAREGVYIETLEKGKSLPLNLSLEKAANFHCSPAATQHKDGSFNLGAVTATASFRFTKWISRWLEISGSKLIIGKGGMSVQDYQKFFVPNGAIYLTTVGYGTGALRHLYVSRALLTHGLRAREA